jgi:uncharacterized membrane protein
MVRLETNFYRHYYDFYRLIRTRGTLTDLQRARQGMLAAVWGSAGIILKIQGILALFLCVVARDLVQALDLAPEWVPLLRVQALAGLGQFLLFVTILFLLYLDRRRAVLLVVTIFLLGNAGLTLVSLSLGEMFYGVGYLVACWGGAILGWWLLNAHLKHLEYSTFMNQPII